MSVSQSPTITDAVSVVRSGVIDSGAVQIARDIVAGYSGDYLFYPVSDHAYALLLGDYTFIQGSTVGLEDAYFASDFDWYLIEITTTTSTVSVSSSGSQSGAFWGYNNSGNYNGSYSGNILVPDKSYSYQVYYYHDSDGVQIENPDCYAVWGSASTLPKLTEGGSMYAYALTALVGVGFAFMLISRIFHHVSGT